MIVLQQISLITLETAATLCCNSVARWVYAGLKLPVRGINWMSNQWIHWAKWMSLLKQVAARHLVKCPTKFLSLPGGTCTSDIHEHSVNWFPTVWLQLKIRLSNSNHFNERTLSLWTWPRPLVHNCHMRRKRMCCSFDRLYRKNGAVPSVGIDFHLIWPFYPARTWLVVVQFAQNEKWCLSWLNLWKYIITPGYRVGLDLFVGRYQ